MKRPGERRARAVVRLRAPGRPKHLDVAGDKSATARAMLARSAPDNDNGELTVDDYLWLDAELGLRPPRNSGGPR